MCSSLTSISGLTARLTEAVSLRAQPQLHLDRDLAPVALLDLLEVLHDPGVGAGEDGGDRRGDDVAAGGLQDAQRRLVGGEDAVLGVQGDDAVGGGAEDALVVVPLVEDVLEELGVLQRDRDLRRERAQPRLVPGVKRPPRLLSTWVTPMQSPPLLTIGMARMLSVWYPVARSTSLLKRGSS